MSEGPAAGKVPIGLEDAILDYYKERGRDENGRPRPELLKKLRLEDI